MVAEGAAFGVFGGYTEYTLGGHKSGPDVLQGAVQCRQRLGPPVAPRAVRGLPGNRCPLARFDPQEYWPLVAPPNGWLVIDCTMEVRFWFSYFSCAYGQLGPTVDPDVLSEALGVSESDALDWWHTFTGWYDGVLDETDGQTDKPGMLHLMVASDSELRVEAHPGDIYVRLASANGHVADVANFGPHWVISGWTLENAVEVAGGNPFALLILAPLIRSIPHADRSAAAALLRDALVTSGLTDSRGASVLASELSRCATNST